jgi:hypothetical protein
MLQQLAQDNFGLTMEHHQKYVTCIHVYITHMNAHAYLYIHDSSFVLYADLYNFFECGIY